MEETLLNHNVKSIICYIFIYYTCYILHIQISSPSFEIIKSSSLAKYETMSHPSPHRLRFQVRVFSPFRGARQITHTRYFNRTPSSLSPGYMNASSPRVGYYACTLSSLCGAALLFLVGWGRQPASPVLPGPRRSSLGIVPPPPLPCACPPPPRPRLPKSQSLHVPLDVEDGMRDRVDFVERMHEHHPIADHYCHPQFHAPLRPSKSVPEGLGHQDPYRSRPRRHRDITVIEQITTSV